METSMRFRYTGLEAGQFRSLFALRDPELLARGICRVIADTRPGFPCRVSLEDAAPGESLLLLPFEHQPADSPYRSSGPIFVRETATTAYDSTVLPPVFAGRVLSVRAYDHGGMMVDADIVEAAEVETLFARMLACDDTAYLHVHNAKRGCYSARVERA
jgi:hypothetical protein